MAMNDELLIKFLLKETSADENTIVQDWLMQSEENVLHFAAYEKIWTVSKNLEVKSDVDTQEAWTRFVNKVDGLSTAEPIVKPIKRNYTWLKIAAVLVLAIGAWSIYSLVGPSNYTDLVAKNEITKQLLPDGSELTINKNTRISYAGNFKNNRSLILKKGEVFFNVTPDKNHPFTIEIANVAVKVVGTSFNIKHLNEETEIVVETGIVSVKLDNQEVQLSKGERLNIDSKTKRLAKVQSSDQLYNYYRTKLFVANNVPLEKLIKVLNEAYGSNITLADDVLVLRFNSTLELGSLNKNLEIICDALKLKISRNEDGILLSKKL